MGVIDNNADESDKDAHQTALFFVFFYFGIFCGWFSDFIHEMGEDGLASIHRIIA